MRLNVVGKELPEFEVVKELAKGSSYERWDNEFYKSIEDSLSFYVELDEVETGSSVDFNGARLPMFLEFDLERRLDESYISLTSDSFDSLFYDLDKTKREGLYVVVDNLPNFGDEPSCIYKVNLDNKRLTFNKLEPYEVDNCLYFKASVDGEEYIYNYTALMIVASCWVGVFGHTAHNY